MKSLTASQMRQLVDKFSDAATVDARVAELAERAGVVKMSIYRYMKSGVPVRANKFVKRELLHAATETGVIETAEAEGGVFL